MRDRVILLVHGYNVDEPGAKASLLDMQLNLRKDSGAIARDTIRVYWAGDSVLPGVRALFYPLMVPRAVQAGEALARAVREFKTIDGDEPEVVVVAHSLGCRVVLEAVAHLQDRRRHLRVFLMAAAVPVEYVIPPGHLSDAVTHLAEKQVFFSRCDTVLRVFFLGQLAARSEGFRLQEPIGLNGGPPGGTWDSRHEMAGYRHGHYWGSERVARTVARALGADVEWFPREHYLPECPEQTAWRIVTRRIGLTRERLPNRWPAERVRDIR